ncbi:pyrroloquinoline quinone-dependent dehydrogenase [Pelagibacterium luteolum]|uniref:Alcohol dehydrogenase (Cytochrome c) n=1 Tax=Pelagibacterium luteolum TaxID=440168 RepID=A0A1G7XYQ1_9HYPH|nr:PQQ-binding-like beta-propeller repeat protein [Pelagibacterium luteolum]SDG89156.1 alcohol dehydrogenase (cytochrome c) [Pelagibacterium luteolum]
MRFRYLLLQTLATAALVCAPAYAQDRLADLAPVTDADLQNVDPGNWLAYGRDVYNFGYSPLTEINADNVDTLQSAWARGIESGQIQTAPLVYDGVMFIASPNEVVEAIDAVTGTLLWQYRHRIEIEPELLNSITRDRKRGIAIYGENIYFATWDNHLVALNMRDGQVVFDIDRGQGDEGISNSSGPIVANGIIVLGSSCQYSGFGCYATGHDAQTGEELWRNYFIPRPGEEGDETWGGSSFESRWMTGAWGQFTYNPELDLVFYGSSSTGPSSEVQRGTVGGTQFGTNTRFAVKPQTGEIVWRHQTLPRDNWDQECTYEMIVDTVNVGPSDTMETLQAINPNAATGERAVLTGVPCKTGTLWQFDAATGEFIYARDTAYQNLIDNVDEDGIVTVNEDVVFKEDNAPIYHCPTFLGGRDQARTAYNPDTKVMFVPLTNACMEQTPRPDVPIPANSYNQNSVYSLPEGMTNAGRIDAVNVETGETVWRYEQEAVNYASLLATGSELVFSGGADRYFKAINQETGELVWQTRLAASPMGTPISYEVDGKQYVAIVTGTPGYGGTLMTRLVPDAADMSSLGAAIQVFALPDAE